MKNKLPIMLLVLAFAIQLYVPVQMIFERESIVKSGKLFKFRTAPIDPVDPLRGKYVRLDFSGTQLKVKDAAKWVALDHCYATLQVDKHGFASVKALSVTEPATADFVKVVPNYAPSDEVLNINFPFDRFYMEESKAPEAEKVHRIAVRDTSVIAYANVYVKNGEAVVDDVLIDGKSLRQIVMDGRR